MGFNSAFKGLTFNKCTLCPRCIYVFCIYLRTNSDLCHLQHKLIGFYKRDEKCLLRGTDWVFKYSSLRVVCKGLNLRIFRKPFKKIQVSLKSDKNRTYFTWRPIYIFVISLSVLLEMRNVSDESCRENQNTQFVFNNWFFLFENRAIYEITWKYAVVPDRPQMTIWRMRIACWIPKTINTHSEYILLTA